MMTFSINIGTNIETTSYKLTGFLGDQSGFNNLINRLPDNKDGLINPPDLRDFFLSICSSTVFKITTPSGSNVSYIGIDTLDPDNKDLKDRKILLGKRSYQSNDIITEDLINSEYDILFYNTKGDNQQQFTTRINLLSGITNFQNSPFIQSQSIFGTQSVSFDFNSNGNIKILSPDISINDYKLPNSASASDGKVISWESDSMVYNNITNFNSSTVGTSSETLNIFGNPTNINGYNFSFSDDRRSPVEIGDIKFGTTFSTFSISEILKRMIYEYLPPGSNIRLLPPHEKGYVEFGELPSVSLEFSIFKKTLSTGTTILLNMIPGSYPAITTQEYFSITATASGLIQSPLNESGVTFSITVSDGTQSSVSSTNIRGVYPYFYGFSNQGTINNFILSQLVKLVEDKSDKSIIIQPGSGFFYFIYDNLYGDLDQILDNNNMVFSNFTLSTQVLSSPDGLWANKVFKIYRINNLQTSIPIIFKFKY